MEEILDIFDEDMNPIGQATKKEAHFKGYRHRSAHIWIYNDKSEVLLQKRSLQKDSYP